jgi:hypothetical protein
MEQTQNDEQWNGKHSATDIHLVSQIDELVFELYGLSEEEKSTVIDSL